MPRDPLKVFLLGPPEVKWAGESLSIPRRQLRALLYIFAAQPNPISREQVCTLLWSELSDASARRHLTRLLTHLRRQLPDGDLVVADSDHVGLDTDRAWSDAWLFDQLQAGPVLEATEHQMRSAVGLYREPFLMGFNLPGSAGFDAWLNQKRYRMERLYLDALGGLVERCAERGDYPAAISYGQRYLATDEIAEDMHRRLIELYTLNGNRNAALRQFERCTLVLESELGVRPLPETRTAYETALHEKSVPPRPASLHSWRSLPAFNLPLSGRETALDELTASLARARSGRGAFVLISGEAGIGKSRLLHHFANSANSDCIVLSSVGLTAPPANPYLPLVQALRSAVQKGLPVDRGSSAWRRVTAWLLPELPELEMPDPVFLKDSLERGALFEALCQVFLSMASGPLPLILCFDDLHQAGAAMLDWVGHLGKFLSHRNLLVVGTYDSDEEPSIKNLRRGLLHLGCLQEITLGGLSLRQVKTLLENAGWHGHLDHQLAARFTSLTGGNPFYLLEYLQAYFETSAGDWARGLAAAPLPINLRTLIRSRLERLTPLGRQILDAGAVLESPFDFDLVHLTAGRKDIETMNGLDELVARRLFLERAGQYQYAHEVIRQVAQEEMSYWRRRLLQRRAREARLHLRPADNQRLDGATGPTSEPVAAARSAVVAGMQALKELDYLQAQEHLDRALVLLAADIP